MTDPVIEAAARVAELRRQSRQEPTSAEFIEVLASKGYIFRFNELTQTVEVNGTPINDATAAIIRCAMRDAGYKGMAAMEDAYTAQAAKNAYHPIREYFDSLEWDGRGHIAQLATHFTDSGPVTPDGVTWFHRAFRRWLVGYAARVYDRAQVPMLVLEGPQRKGKSHFARWLASILPDYFIEAAIEPDNKDSLLRLATSFIWEVSELGATVRKSDIEALKSFITLNTVTVRRAYAKFDLHLPAVAGLIGTVNDSGGFLNDSTGTRRALVIPVTSIDWQYAQTVNVIQLWAEAVAAYQAGEPATLTDDEREAQAEINQRFEVPDPVADVIDSRFEIDATQTEWFTPSSEIVDTIDAALKGTSDGHAKRIAAALKRHGIEQARRYVNGRRVRGYPGVMRRNV